MSRLLPLLPLVFWLSYTPARDANAPGVWRLSLFFGGFLFAIATLRLWAAVILRGDGGDVYRRAGRFQAVCGIARMALAAWFGYGIYTLGWGELVTQASAAARLSAAHAPAAVLAIVPAMLAWLGIAWAQYPIERRWREQNVLVRFDDMAPLHPPPTLGQHLEQSLRLQLLFTIVPVIALIATRDVLTGVLHAATPGRSTTLDTIAYALAGIGVFVFAPPVLTRVLPTSNLPDGPLRERLLGYCSRVRLRVRSIKLWHTHHTLSNAAVMGVLPQIRTVMLSDLLIETLDAGQIEAVFAHEAGHIRHRHMIWYVLFVVAAVLSLDRPLTWATEPLVARAGAWQAWADNGLLVIGAIAWVVVFGKLSRRCERQADWYAARTIDPGADGGERFAQTLRRVAIVNGMPLTKRPSSGRPLADAFARVLDSAAHFLHGSIASRMDHVRMLAASPDRAGRFGATMTLSFAAIATLLLVSLAATFLLPTLP